jgi:hypothetical protein
VNARADGSAVLTAALTKESHPDAITRPLGSVVLAIIDLSPREGRREHTASLGTVQHLC